MRIHQPDQAVFRSVLPEDIDWEPFPAFPASARLAIVVGHPTEPGPYVIRVKVPSGVKLMPHRHPEDRVYTVMSGVFYIGVGEQFDDRKLEAYPPGAVIVLPGGTPHFHWARSGEYITSGNRDRAAWTGIPESKRRPSTAVIPSGAANSR
jgi:quercetin dioxygenase-like cupin family protein